MTNQIIKGSLREVSRNNNKSLALNFMNVKAVVMVDVSYSMAEKDVGNNKSRFDAACEQLEILQNQNSGEIADGCGIKLIIISDGEPQDESAAMALASKFRSKIDTIFVGSETGRGREFLRKLSMQTGGVSIVNNTNKLNLLSENITHLLAA